MPTELLQGGSRRTSGTRGFKLYRLGRSGTPTLIDTDGSIQLNFAEFKGKLYFTASSEETGFELYRLGRNGTPILAADINRGIEGSGPSNFFVL